MHIVTSRSSLRKPPVRQDQLDAVVWTEVVRLLEDPRIIQEELNRRLEAARNADPLKQRQEQLRRDRARLAKGMDRLLIAYQEGLVSLEQLRCRMPELRKQDQALQANCSRWKRSKAIKPGICGWSRRLPILAPGCGRGQTRWTCPSDRRSCDCW